MSRFTLPLSGTASDTAASLKMPLGMSADRLIVSNEGANPIYVYPSWYPTPSSLAAEVVKASGIVLTGTDVPMRKKITADTITGIAANTDTDYTDVTISGQSLLVAADVARFEGIVGTTELNGKHIAVVTNTNGANDVLKIAGVYGDMTAYVSGGRVSWKGGAFTRHFLKVNGAADLYKVANHHWMEGYPYLYFRRVAPPAGTYDVVLPRPYAIPAMTSIDIPLAAPERELKIACTAGLTAAYTAYMITEKP